MIFLNLNWKLQISDNRKTLFFQNDQQIKNRNVQLFFLLFIIIQNQYFLHLSGHFGKKSAFAVLKNMQCPDVTWHSLKFSQNIFFEYLSKVPSWIPSENSLWIVPWTSSGMHWWNSFKNSSEIFSRDSFRNFFWDASSLSVVKLNQWCILKILQSFLEKFLQQLILQFLQEFLQHSRHSFV